MTTATLPLDLLSPEYIDDPQPMIDRMLSEAPMFFDPRLHGWMVGRYQDVQALQASPKLTASRAFYVSAALPPELQAQIKPLVDWYQQWIVMMDPPEHTRLRRLGGQAFRPKEIERMRERIAEVVDELIDAVIERGEMEFLADFAIPLPQTIICEMVGIPLADRQRFIEWTNDLTLLLGAALNTPEAIAHALDSYTQMKAYFDELLPERRKRPIPGEVLSNLVIAAEEHDQLTADEVINLVAFIMTGGYETTTRLLSNGIWLLFSDPEQLAKVRADPSLIPGWIEETLRCEPSITINVRSVAAPFVYEGHELTPGQMVYFVISAANRDPAQFPDPHRFDVTRTDNKHLTFGFGAHFCLGAALARMEAQIGFRKLLERLPKLAMPEQEILRLPNFVVRPITQLRLTF
ncbi:MAG: cytochrome P450 [Enhygromyxa sp.]